MGQFLVYFSDATNIDETADPPPSSKYEEFSSRKNAWSS